MNNNTRKRTIQIIIIAIAVVFISRLFYVQVIDKTSASEIRMKEIRPPRGLIKDRTGEILVANQPMYDLMLTSINIRSFDTSLLCGLIEVSEEVLIYKLKKAKKHPYNPFLFKRQLNFKEHATLQEQLYLFPGFYTEDHSERIYPFSTASHVLGYIGKVDSQEILKYKGAYSDQDLIGKTGLERIYEHYLKGKKGKEWILYDVHNRVKGKYMEGVLDSLPRPGFSLISSLDIELQNYGESLMKNKKGSVVAIEPSTGEILAFISSPGYDPNHMIGSKRGLAFEKLKEDTLKPLFNRPVMAMYPPGSTFKTIMSLIGLQESVIVPKKRFQCKGEQRIPGIVSCHDHEYLRGLRSAIRYSCNNYFSFVLKDYFDLPGFSKASVAYEKWHKYVAAFGLGKKITKEFLYEAKGNLPKKEYYDNLYGKGRWKAPTIISLSVGQGELLMTPIQIANLFAAIANRGYYITPHLIKGVELDDGIKTISFDSITIPIDKRHFEELVSGLKEVVEKGTARASRIKNIEMCGKTGTSENPHGEDHSVFAAFAPKEDPEIAIAVFVENSGYGSVWAAPIASLMIEKYINKKITGKQRKYLEKRMLEGSLID